MPKKIEDLRRLFMKTVSDRTTCEAYLVGRESIRIKIPQFSPGLRARGSFRYSVRCGYRKGTFDHMPWWCVRCFSWQGEHAQRGR